GVYVRPLNGTCEDFLQMAGSPIGSSAGSFLHCVVSTRSYDAENCVRTIQLPASSQLALAARAIVVFPLTCRRCVGLTSYGGPSMPRTRAAGPTSRFSDRSFRRAIRFRRFTGGVLISSLPNTRLVTTKSSLRVQARADR